MIIAGLEKTSFVDWPENICSTVFIAGCNFKCGFCHNPELVLPEEIEKCETMSETELLTALVSRLRFIDGVCITGGEPLLSPDVVMLIRKIKAKGLKVKLDTNGSFPTLLKNLLDEKLLDYVAMDIKGPLHKYGDITNTRANTNLIEESVRILKQSNIDYEFRTTVVKSLLTKEDIIDIGKWLAGANAYYLQRFDNEHKMIDAEYRKVKSYAPDELKEMIEEVKPYFKKTGIRGI